MLKSKAGKAALGAIGKFVLGGADDAGEVAAKNLDNASGSGAKAADNGGEAALKGTDNAAGTAASKADALTHAGKAGKYDDLNYDKKISDQMENRGWTQDEVKNTVENPAKTGSTTDGRTTKGGGQNNDPATAYADKDGHHVIVNDNTGNIVQVSDKKRPWKDDSRIKWDEKD